MAADRPVGSCTDPACEQHYACRLRNKGLQVSPRAQMTRTQNWRPTPFAPPTRNKEIIYSERAGGTKMPLLNPDGSVVRRKQYDERRPQIEFTIRTLRSGAAPQEG